MAVLHIGGNYRKNCNVFNMERLLYNGASILAENMYRKVYFKKRDFIMVRSIDFKDALIGGFVVAMILFLAGAVYYLPQDDFGRFEIEVNDGHAFVLDSATGQVWLETLINPGGGIRVIEPDPNFYTPKIILRSTTGY